MQRSVTRSHEKQLAPVPMNPSAATQVGGAAVTDTSMPHANTPISYKRNPWLDDPEYIYGYTLVKTFVSVRGRVCYVYADSTTGEHVYGYGPLTSAAI